MKSEARRQARAARREERRRFAREAERLAAEDPAALDDFVLAALRADPTNRVAVAMLFGEDRERAPDRATLERRARADGHDAIDLARLAVAEAAAQSGAAALTLARDAIDGAEGDLRETLRDALLSAFDWHGHADAARAIAFHAVASEGMARASGRLGRVWAASRFDHETPMLLELGCGPDNPEAEATLVARLRYLWRVAGASDTLVRLCGAWIAAYPASAGRLRAERVAMLVELGRLDDARALLSVDPTLAGRFREALPIAWLLRETGAGPADEIAPYAALFDAFDAGERMLADLLDPVRTLAIVGNSPCELGLGNGGTIDAADVVVRFNRGIPDALRAADYGRRTTIHVLPIRKSAADYPPAGDADLIAYAVPSARYTNRDWQTALAHHQSGRALAALPAAEYRALAHRLAAPPSAGLRVLQHVHAARGRLDQSSLFGFAFVDQIGRDARSSHFFEASVPSMHHNWCGEAVLVTELLASEQRERG